MADVNVKCMCIYKSSIIHIHYLLSVISESFLVKENKVNELIYLYVYISVYVD